MSRCLTIGLVLAALCGTSTFAYARPPTVLNSPGYDRRLQESRSQLGTPAPVSEPAAPKPKRTSKKHPN